ncbi:MAG TPA: ribosome-associated translation inhibitor RaiA [bacterium]|jgi:putative sigma-54 modulation protein|nr:ribosome-associated translation inhibitor RaiA [bacterium]
MQVQVTGQHLEITPALKQFIQGKLAKLEEMYPKVRTVAVVVAVEKYRHTAEIHFRADGVEMSAKKTTKDMYASIEEAIAALEQQAGKRKDRLHTSGALRRTAAKDKRRNARGAAFEAAKVREAVVAPKPRVVRVKSPAAKVLSVDAAVASLEASEKPFLMFREERGGAVQLLFRREDGTYGLSEA